MADFEDFLQEQLQDDEFRREYEALRPEREAVQTMLDAKCGSGSTPKRLPMGIEFFDEIIKENYYYIDKTDFITELAASLCKVNLIVRPKGFGNTLNLTMLKNFFEIGADKSLLEGLNVSKEKDVCDAYMGKFPVIYVPFGGIYGQTFEEARYSLCRRLWDATSRMQFLETSDRLDTDEKDMFKRIGCMDAGRTDIICSLRNLCHLLKKHYGQDVILLIDEYDAPLEDAQEGGYYLQMLDLLHGMLSNALKGNEDLNFAVMTGCLNLSHESIYGGLNNIKTFSPSDERYDRYFGFTDDEVRKLLADYGLEDHYEEVREWYGGHHIGDRCLYCPCDVIGYCDDASNQRQTSRQVESKVYWNNARGNDALDELLKMSSEWFAIGRDIEELIEGGTLVMSLNDQMTHDEKKCNVKNMWTMLYKVGYLTAEQAPDWDLYRLKIPNREVREIYKRRVTDWFKRGIESETDKFPELYEALESEDTESIAKLLSEQLYGTISFYDGSASFYQEFVCALVRTCSQWGVATRLEIDHRSHIIVERRGLRQAFIIAVEAVSEKMQLDAACDAALKRIKGERDIADLRRIGVNEITAYGIVFWGKNCVVKAEHV